MDELKTSILLYINHFTTYDYLAYTWLIGTFFLLLLLAVIFMKRSSKFSLFIIFVAFILFFSGPMFLKDFLDKTIRPIMVKDVSFEKLHFSHTLILNWKVENLSKKSYNECKTTAMIYKPAASKIKLLINKLEPIFSRTAFEEQVIKPNEIVNKNMVFNNFNYNDDINVSIRMECY